MTFQPKGAHILTPDNEIIKLNRQRGLYFLPSEDRKWRDRAYRAAVAVDEEHVHAMEEDTATRATERQVRRTMRVLKRTGYNHRTAGRLRLDANCVTAAMEAGHDHLRLARRVDRRTTGFGLALTRSQREKLASKAATKPRNEPARPEPSRKTRTRSKEGSQKAQTGGRLVKPKSRTTPPKASQPFTICPPHQQK